MDNRETDSSYLGETPSSEQNDSSSTSPEDQSNCDSVETPAIFVDPSCLSTLRRYPARSSRGTVATDRQRVLRAVAKTPNPQGRRGTNKKRPSIATPATSVEDPSSPPRLWGKKDERDEVSIAADRRKFMDSLLELSRQHIWISQLRSASVERQKFQARFIELYFSKDGTRFAGFEYILQSAPRSPALTHALDALSLAHVGNASKDSRLRQAARGTYGLAVSKVRHELTEPNRDPSLLLSAMHLLSTCELFIDIAAPDGLGARRHCRGAMQLMEAFDPKTLDPYMRDVLGTQFRGLVIWDATFERKSLRGLKLLERAFSDETNFSTAIEIVKISVRIPAILERGEAVCRMGTTADLEFVFNTINRIVALEGELHDSMTAWYNTTKGAPYHLRPLWELQGVQPQLTKHKEVFPQALVFPDALSAHHHRSYWILLLMLIRSRLKLQKKFAAYLVLKPKDDHIQRLVKSAYEYADNLCMSIAFDTQRENGYLALFNAMFPLQMALHWYEEQEDSAKVAWCQSAMGIFQAEGLRPPGF